MPAYPNRFDTLLSDLRALRQTYGYSTFDRAVRTLNRERLETPSGRPARHSYAWAEYKRLYASQRGICPLCGLAIPLVRGELHMDHKDPQLIGEAFDARDNRQVTHAKCNMKKGAKNLSVYSKVNSRTVLDMVDDPGADIEDV